MGHFIGDAHSVLKSAGNLFKQLQIVEDHQLPHDHLRENGCLIARISLISRELENTDSCPYNNYQGPEFERVIAALQSLLEPPPDRKNTRLHRLLTRAKKTSESPKLKKFRDFLESSDSETVAKRQTLLRDCEILVQHVENESRNNPDHMMAIPAKNLPIEYPPTVKGELLSGLRGLSKCISCSDDVINEKEFRWHPTQLLLENRPCESDSPDLNFSAIVAPIPPGAWQDIGLRIPMRRNIPFANPSQKRPMYQEELEQGQGSFCRIIESDLSARACFNFHEGKFVQLYDSEVLEQRPSPGPGITLAMVFQRCNLERKDMCILAHILAQAFWQFYDTRLLDHKWTSDCVIFMPERSGDDRRLPIKPYVSIHRNRAQTAQPEYLSESSLIHRYPRILAFAIILIEIGLRKSLHLPQKKNLVSQVNSDFEAAHQGLKKLGSSWGRDTTSQIFLETVSYCLNSKNFESSIDADINSSPHRPTIASDVRSSAEIRQRRRNLYNKVVLPMHFLARIAYQYHESSTYLLQNHDSLNCNIKPTLPNGSSSEAILPSPLTGFHAGSIAPDKWLEDLKRINAEIKPKLRLLPKESNKVHIALLDTGYDPQATIIKEADRRSCFHGWKDFVSNSDIPIDTHGHGTFMATLVVESAPVSTIHVARVAKDTETLKENASNVANAIRWAGLEVKVDVISMSFGFSVKDTKSCEEIRRAIEEVRIERDWQIIFLASAGNSASFADETFPASHPEVISMRATNSRGKFLTTNPPNKSECSTVFGAIGDDIPEKLKQFRPSQSTSGSSAATAVAAAIAVFMLAYARVLPIIVDDPNAQERMETAKTGDGMVKLFKEISSESGPGQKFLNPSKFWLDRRTPYDRYTAIHSCLNVGA